MPRKRETFDEVKPKRKRSTFGERNRFCIYLPEDTKSKIGAFTKSKMGAFPEGKLSKSIQTIIHRYHEMLSGRLTLRACRELEGYGRD